MVAAEVFAVVPVPPPGTLCAHCGCKLGPTWCVVGGKFMHAKCAGSLR